MTEDQGVIGRVGPDARLDAAVRSGNGRVMTGHVAEHVRLDRREGYAVLTVDRPEKRNALSFGEKT